MNLVTALPHLNPLYKHQPEVFILKRLLNRYNIKVDSDLLYQKLLEHPYFPSLFSISEVLTSLNVLNESYKIKLLLLKENFETPILIHVNIGSGQFYILDKIKNDKYKIFTENGESQWLDESTFTEIWDGVILNVDISDVKGQINVTSDNSYPTHLKYFFALFLSISAFYIFQYRVIDLSINLKLLLILNTVGILISWLIVLQHLNNNVLVQKLCDSKTQDGCNAVIGDKTSQLTSWLSMADSSLIYFSGNILIILVLESPSSLYYLAIISPLFSVYAIYLQAYIIKIWCRLCLAAHAVIFFSFIISASSIWHQFIPSISIKELIVFLIPGIIWLCIKPYIKILNEARHYRKEYSSFKFNPEVFTTLIDKQTTVDIPANLKIFSFGNLNSEHELIFVSNPFCGPCAKAHLVIDEWLSQDIDFKITIIFTHSSEKDERRRLFVEHISNLYDSQKLLRTLHEWFDDPSRSVQKWVHQNHLTPSKILYQDHDLQLWLDKAGVNGTPTFFVNGKLLPPMYRIADIRYLIAELPVKHL